MSRGEFLLIEKYFSSPAVTRADVSLGVGDDCALLEIPPGKQIAVTMDTLVEGRHFFSGTDPWRLGWKVLAVSLSDLASMGAEPAWATLAVTLPHIDEPWLDAFMQGFSTLATRHGVQLIGGDTTKGSLAFTAQLHGFVDRQQVMLRSGARPGDLIYVTGTLGDAGTALQLLLDESAPDLPGILREKLEKPIPRVNEGIRLASLASSCIDLSDGLVGDLQHILDASGCGALVELVRIPHSTDTEEYMLHHDAWDLPVVSGDDYELLFTIPPENRSRLALIEMDLACSLTMIGTIEPEQGLRFVDIHGQSRQPGQAYDHFRDND